MLQKDGADYSEVQLVRLTEGQQGRNAAFFKGTLAGFGRTFDDGPRAWLDSLG
ncbi:hypothetical protein JCM15764A_09110 [Geotalea toluenoxydans]